MDGSVHNLRLQNTQRRRNNVRASSLLLQELSLGEDHTKPELFVEEMTPIYNLANTTSDSYKNIAMKRFHTCITGARYISL